jgi:4'-phosphopantetheinyl transferase EntD
MVAKRADQRAAQMGKTSVDRKAEHLAARMAARLAVRTAVRSVACSEHLMVAWKAAHSGYCSVERTVA